MQSQDLARAFSEMANGNAEPFPEAVQTLYGWLSQGSHKNLFDLSLALTRMEDEAAMTAFDGMMDMLCVEPVQFAEHPTSGWRTYAMLTLFYKPAGAFVSSINNADEVARAIANHIGLDTADVRLVQYHLPTDVAFGLTPVEAFSYCHRLKAMAELDSSVPDSASEKTKLTRMLSQQPVEIPANGWFTGDTDPVIQETLWFVLIRGGASQSAEQFAALQALSDTSLQLQMQYEMEGEGERVIQLHHNVVEFGGPWGAFRGALHVAQAFSLGLVIRDVAEEQGLALADLTVNIARVDEVDGNGHSTRAAVQDKNGNLVAGVVEFDLAEPDQYVTAASRTLGALGISAVHYSTGAYLNSEVDQGKQYTMLVPGKNWQVAPCTFVPTAYRG